MGFLKKITKPISRFLDKIVPNEIKPALPYLSAMAPFMMGPGATTGNWLQRALHNPAMRAGIMGGTNIASQLAQEGSEGEFSGLSALLAAGTGYGTAGGAYDALEKFKPVMGGEEGFSGWDAWKTRGIEGLQRGSDWLGTQADILRPGGEPLTMANALTAGSVPITQGTADLAMITARQALDDFEDEALETGMGVNDDGRRIAIRSAMEAADHLEEDILDALASLGLKQGGIVGLKQGGRIGYRRGSGPAGGASAGGNYGGDSSGGYSDRERGRQQQWSPGAGGTQHIPTTPVRTTPVRTGPSQDDIRMIQETIQNVTPSVIDSTILDRIKMGRVPNRYNYLNNLGDEDEIQKFSFADMGITPTDTDTGTRVAKVYDKGALEGIGAKSGLFGASDKLEAMQEYYDAAQKKPMHYTDPNQIRNYIQDHSGMGQSYSGIDMDLVPKDFLETKEDYQKQISPYKLFGKARGGIMNAKRGLVNAPGGYAGDKEEVDFGGITEAVTAVEKTPKKFLVDKLEVTVMPGQSEMMAIINAMMNDIDGVMPDDRKQEFYNLYLPQLRDNGEISEKEYNFLMGELFNKANGGRINKAGGGVTSVLPKGKEADYRGGGVIPVGSRERADDVPARLSKNEFVMTADAVRAAGGGSVNKGAKRMYNLMHNLEARV